MAEYYRRLPHYHPEAASLFLTWRLWGSLPALKVKDQAASAGCRFLARDQLLDRADSGPLWLKDRRIADLVAAAIRAGECERRYYELHAWAIMPNHVHLLILPRVAVRKLMRWLKGSTARYANQLLERTGKPFWQDESYDHYVRDRRELDRIGGYIERNPVSAGLVAAVADWPWSSAAREGAVLR